MFGITGQMCIWETRQQRSPVPDNAYVVETDDTIPYVAEDGTTVYVQETP